VSGPGGDPVCAALALALAAGACGAPEGPRLPLGWYSVVRDPPSSLEEVRSDGLSMVMPYVGVAAPADPETIQAYLDGAARVKVAVLLEITRPAVALGDAAAVEAFVGRFRLHPALSGWYLYDEPENQALAPSLVRAMADVVRRADPAHPIAVAFGPYGDPPSFAGAFDVLMYDEYPCTAGQPEGTGLDLWFAHTVAAAGRAGAARFWPILQAYGEDADGVPQFGRRLPSAREERFLFYGALVAGARGLFFWMRDRSRPEWISGVLQPLLREAAPHLRAFAAGARPVESDAPSVVAATFGTVLVAVHAGDGDVAAELRVGGRARRVELGPFGAAVVELAQ